MFAANDFSPVERLFADDFHLGQADVDAFGSGRWFAMGALHALYDRLDSAEEIARAAMEASTALDDGSQMPMTLRTIKLAP